jgi:4-amino-4-deoxy-L-arabinose transferase-like glycosyltransferase
MALLLPLAIGLWPLLFPMWFPEAARIGNDSLIVLFAACTLLLVDRAAREAAMPDHVALGATLGLALITKATFLPVAAAAAIVLAALAWSVRRVPDKRARRLKGFAVCFALAAGISAWWYLGKLVETGSLIGSTDAVAAKAHGGVLADLPNVLTRYRLMLVAWVLPVSFLWYGTWSFVQPPGISMVPFFGLVAMLLFGLYRYFRERGPCPADWFALLAFSLFAAGLGYQSLILLVLTANPAPTWYLHSISPILALFVGCGIAGAAGFFWLRQLMTLVFFYALVFFPAVTLLDLLFFTGCAPLIPKTHYFSLEDGMRCMADFPRLFDNLAVLAFPRVGFGLFVAGWLVMLAGTIGATRYLAALSARFATRAAGLAARA